jgi:DNA-binding transcriptional LysR family regulator
MGMPLTLHDRVSHRLKLRDLRLLVAVAEWGSMAKAAAHLNLPQSGVSKAIVELEHTFGVRLFDRTAQGAEPTLYGRELLKSGVAVFETAKIHPTGILMANPGARSEMFKKPQ